MPPRKSVWLDLYDANRKIKKELQIGRTTIERGKPIWWETMKQNYYQMFVVKKRNYLLSKEFPNESKI